MTTRNLLISAAAALVAGALLSTGAFAAAPSVSTGDITKVSAVKADKGQYQVAQAKKKAKKKAKKGGKKKKKM
jgi:hypothetical protein